MRAAAKPLPKPGMWQIEITWTSSRAAGDAGRPLNGVFVGREDLRFVELQLKCESRDPSPVAFFNGLNKVQKGTEWRILMKQSGFD